MKCRKVVMDTSRSAIVSDIFDTITLSEFLLEVNRDRIMVEEASVLVSSDV